MSSARSNASGRPRRGPGRTSPTTAGWLGIIAFLFLAGLGVLAAVFTVGGYALPRVRPREPVQAHRDPAPGTVDRLRPDRDGRTGPLRREPSARSSRSTRSRRSCSTRRQRWKTRPSGRTPGSTRSPSSAQPWTRSAAIAAAPRRSPNSSSATGCSIRNWYRTRIGRSSASSRRSSSPSGSPRPSRARRASRRSSLPT